MNKTFKPWQKQLDDFDGARKGLPALESTARVWGVVAPALPALYDAIIRYTPVYDRTARDLREWIVAHEEDEGDPEEFGRRLFATIESARRLKGLIDAYDREKAVAEALYPEMAGGSLKDTAVPLPAPLRADAPYSPVADTDRLPYANGQDSAQRAPRH